MYSYVIRVDIGGWIGGCVRVYQANRITLNTQTKCWTIG